MFFNQAWGQVRSQCQGRDETKCLTGRIVPINSQAVSKLYIHLPIQIEMRGKAQTFFSKAHNLEELPSLMNKLMSSKEMKNSMTFSTGSSSTLNCPDLSSSLTLMKASSLSGSDSSFSDFEAEEEAARKLKENPLLKYKAEIYLRKRRPLVKKLSNCSLESFESGQQYQCLRESRMRNEIMEEEICQKIVRFLDTPNI